MIKYYCLTFFVFTYNLLQAQVEPLESRSIPPSPNAASLGKFGDVPVSYYTGTPDISIPLFNLTGRALSVPIGISYHPSGIRVEEVASSVGLGWTLNAGGAIVRIMNGRPDEEFSKGRLSHDIEPYTVVNESEANQLEYYRRITNGELDFEPDLFIYNFNGRSGKFFLEKREGVVKGYPIPYVPIDITMENEKFTIVDEGGNKYVFGEEAVETTVSTSHGSTRSSIQVNNFVSSYYLKKIVSVKAEEISFTYDSYDISYCQRTSETHHNYVSNTGPQNCPVLSPSYSFGETEIQGKRLKTITSTLGTVTFIPYEFDRQDLPGDKAIHFVEVKNTRGEFVKKYEFIYGYFNTTSATNTSFSLCNDPSRTLRLRLDQVVEVGRGGELKPPHKFAYNTTKLPDKFSNSVDHWGYFNGIQNAVLVPQYSFYRNNELVKLSGAKRRAVETSMKAASLEKITYPTGGYTLLEMEGNEAYVDKDFFPYEQDFVVPQVSYATLRRQDGVNQYADFTVNLPEYEPGIKGGTFKITTTYSTPCTPGDREGCGGTVSLENRDTGVFLYSSNGGLTNITTKSEELFLPNGNYRLYFEMYDVNNTDGLYRGYVSGPDPNFVPPLNHKIGGLRVSKIKNYNEENEFVSGQKFTYMSEEDPNKSSGVVVSKPIYAYPYQLYGVGPPNAGQFANCTYLTRTAVSNAPLSSTQGSAVGYKWVQVYDLDAKDNVGINGKQVFRYTTAEEYPDNLFYQFPFPPHSSYDWMRGLVKEIHTFRRESNGSYSEVQNVTNGYLANKFSKAAPGLKVGCEISQPSGCLLYRFLTYNVVSYWGGQESSVQVDIHNGVSSTSSTKTFFDNIQKHPYPTRMETTDSENRIAKVLIKYPQDYTTTAANSINNLIEKHQLNIPIETQKWIEDKWVEGKIMKYSDDNTPVIQELWNLEIDNPVTGYVDNKASGRFTDFIPLASYKKKDEFKYNSNWSISQYRKSESGQFTSLLRGYNQSLIVAEIINAESDQVFYESFEESGVWGNAKTGDRYNSSGSYTIPFTPADQSSSLMSYWYLENSNWKFSGIIPFSQTINQGSGLDEVRVFPKGSTMTTMTYRPLIGITSRTDSNNTTMHYEYDAFNRVIRIMDHDKNVVQSFKYNYYGQN